MACSCLEKYLSVEDRQKLEFERSYFIGKPISESEDSSFPETEYVITEFKVILKLDSNLENGAVVKVKQKRNYCLKGLSFSSQYRVRYEFVEGHVNASYCTITESDEAADK